MILLDAGPLVAIVDADDQHHRRCLAALRGLDQPLGTVWPAITEALYRLMDVSRGPDVVLEMVERRAVQLLPLDDPRGPRTADRPLRP